MKAIKIDRSTLPEDGQKVMFVPDDTETPTEGVFSEGDDYFVEPNGRFTRSWDVAEWCDIDDYEPMSDCCSAPIIMESKICSACKEHV